MSKCDEMRELGYNIHYSHYNLSKARFRSVWDAAQEMLRDNFPKWEQVEARWTGTENPHQMLKPRTTEEQRKAKEIYEIVKSLFEELLDDEENN